MFMKHLKISIDFKYKIFMCNKLINVMICLYTIYTDSTYKTNNNCLDYVFEVKASRKL